MLTGRLRATDAASRQRLHEAALTVLERTGLRIRGRFLLEALAGAGCRVDFAGQQAWFRPDLVERQVGGQRGRCQAVRSSLWYPFCRQLPPDGVAFPDEFTCDFGFAAPWLYDLASGSYRQPTVSDQIQMIRLGDVLEPVRAVCAPLICCDLDPRVEIVESARLLLRHTAKPGWVGTSRAAEVKHLAALARLVTGGDEAVLRTQPPLVVNAYCTTSPLKLDSRSCEVLEEALKYGFPVNFAPMPILGGTAPVTPAGAAVVAAAEILGALTACTLVDPEVLYYATAICGEMDMRTTQVCYATPTAVLADLLLHELFRDRYGMVLNVEPAYVEAKAPGIQAAWMKCFRQMAFGSTVSHSFPLGLLDNGAVFSPAQAMLDLDTSRAMYLLCRGAQVSAETLAVDVIDRMGFCDGESYLQAEHTARHFRQGMWASAFFDRGYRGDEPRPVAVQDGELLRRADAAWREVVADHQDPELPGGLLAQIDRIVEAARAELLAQPRS